MEPSPFVVEGIEYKTAEHWMMAQKALLFGDDESFKKIISAETPEKAKSLGRQVRRFNDEVWVSKRMEAEHRQDKDFDKMEVVGRRRRRRTTFEGARQ